MSKRMPGGVGAGPPSTPPQFGWGAVGGDQLGLSFPVGDVADHVHGVYDALQATVDECMGGPVAFAAVVERPVSDVSRRLRRAEDSKGETQRAPVDYLAALATSHEARLCFINHLCALWGLRPTEPIMQLTDSEKLRILASELPDRRRRALEREHGLPKGALEP